MSYFAKVVDSRVVDIISAEPEFMATYELEDTTPGEWIQTSYNVRGGEYYLPDTDVPAENQENYINDDYPERKRKNYAQIGGWYDAENDRFIPPKPYRNWVLNDTTCLWEPPIPYPDDAFSYYWDEDGAQWSQFESVNTPDSYGGQPKPWEV